MKLWIKIILGLAVIGIIAAAVVCNYINKEHPDYASSEPELFIKPKRLYTDYTKNLEMANEKYTGKIIQLEGNISKVELADSLVILTYVYQEGDFGDEGIRVTLLQEFNKEAIHLSPFKSLKVKGLCTGYNDTDVIFEKGSIIKEKDSIIEEEQQ